MSLSHPAENQVLGRELTCLKGVGEKMASKLSGMGLGNLQDLLFHLPYRYQDRTRIAPLGSLQPGATVAIDVVVRAAQVVFGRRRSLLVRVQDHTGTLSIRLFYFTAAQKNQLSSGQRLLCFGEVRPGPSGLEMIHPEYRFLEQGAKFEPEQSLTPWYPTTEGIQQLKIRDLVKQGLDWVDQLQDWIPQQLLENFGLPDLPTAIKTLHHPPSDQDPELFLQGNHPCQKRLALEELLAHHLSLRQKRLNQFSEIAPVSNTDFNLASSVEQALPFKLTAAQKRVLSEIRKDFSHPFPASRLIQGDVGSGKTLVALLAGLQAVASGFQFAMMAPTEILAEQHFRNISQWVVPFGIQVTCLTGKLTRKERDSRLSLIASGEAKIIIGTHALFQDSVHYLNLALIVIDEQHRFGVDQRMALRNKSSHNNWIPHQLAMTATPIPRTLAQSMYADLDYSVIDELPPGRQSITTRILSAQRRDELIHRVSSACHNRRQVFWVCTLIEESEELQCQAAEDTAEMLRSTLPDLRIGLVHGRMKPSEKHDMMAAFQHHELDILVATTVIEVGVDVPNASVMIIENPERLGLSQLHQLRGRVGRGTKESFCLLVYGDNLSQIGKQRLEVMRQTQDGFVIAEKDLLLRGPGEIMGTRQTGLQQFKVASLPRDIGLLDDVKLMADYIHENCPDVIAPLIKRWLNLREKYANI